MTEEPWHAAKLIPLFLGLSINTWWKSLRNIIVEPVNKLANVLFPVMLLLVLVNDFQSIVALVGSTGLLAIVILVVICLAAGHLLGGPADATRSTLAITTAQRNLGLGFLVAATAFPASLGPIAAYGVVQIVLSTLYVGVMAKRAGVKNPVQEEFPEQEKQHAPGWSPESPGPAVPLPE